MSYDFHAAEIEHALHTIALREPYEWDRLQAWLIQHAPGSELSSAVAEILEHVQIAADLITAIDSRPYPFLAIEKELGSDIGLDVALPIVLSWKRPTSKGSPP